MSGLGPNISSQSHWNPATEPDKAERLDISGPQAKQEFLVEG
jgi:hypothetical protein